MRRVMLFSIAFASGLAALHHADNPPPSAAALHADRSMRAIAQADAQVTRARATLGEIAAR